MTNETLLLGLDAGASSTKWALLTPSLEVVASGRSAPLTGHIFTDTQRAENFAALETLACALAAFKPTHAVAGITGLSMGDEVAQFYQQALLEVLGLTNVSVMSDMDLAYLAHFEPGEGILVYAGTGGIAYHLKADGSVARAGGRGYLISDPGGGFSIGQKALEFVTTLMDVLKNLKTIGLPELFSGKSVTRAIGQCCVNMCTQADGKRWQLLLKSLVR
jgi:glucosamine kinase